MRLENKESYTKICSICGEHIGMGFNHEECSKAKKEIYGDSHENKHPKKRLEKNNIEWIIRRYT